MQNPRNHRLALDHELEIAQEIGLIMSAFAILELTPPAMLSKLIGIDQQHSEIVMGHIRSFANRLEVLQKVAESLPENEEKRGRALELISDLRACSDIRNNYAHGMWQGVAPDDRTVEVHLLGWLAEARRNSKRTVVDVTSIRADCAKLRACVHKLTIFAPPNVPYP